MKKIDTLCIVDDDNMFQLLTRIIVEKTKLVQKVKIFSNGKEAIEFLYAVQNQPEKIPDVILLDLNMPVLDGWGFLEEYIMIKPKLGKKIVIYIVSSSIDPEDIEKARTISEITDYLVKPVTQEKFIKILGAL
ncbi:MAG: response regulator [Mangrovibacterium sp.]